MARNQVTQRQRTAKDPLLVGEFEETSIRYLKGTLGGKNQPITSNTRRVSTWRRFFCFNYGNSYC